MNLKGKVAVAGLTDTGQVREHNEDSISFDARRGLLVLADGMGGQQAGEVASALAVKVVMHEMLAVLPRLGSASASEEDSDRQVANALEQAVVRANKAVFKMSRSRPEYLGMGTTLVVLLFRDDRVTVAHVGDSRTYRLRGEELEQITLDHSLVQELVNQGVYTPEQAQHANNRSILTRAIGTHADVDCDVREEPVLPGDAFLICSDGLSDMVDDAIIRAILMENQDNLDRAAEVLVETANECGGRDNISVLLARVDRPFPMGSGWLQRLTGWFA